MPNCDFYATPEDHVLVLDWLFADGACEVYESYSDSEQPLKRFRSSMEVLQQFERRHRNGEAWHKVHLHLHVARLGQTGPRHVGFQAHRCAFSAAEPTNQETRRREVGKSGRSAWRAKALGPRNFARAVRARAARDSAPGRLRALVFRRQLLDRPGADGSSVITYRRAWAACKRAPRRCRRRRSRRGDARRRDGRGRRNRRVARRRGGPVSTGRRGCRR